jgi:hypothetical protein
MNISYDQKYRIEHLICNKPLKEGETPALAHVSLVVADFMRTKSNK